MYVDVEQLSMAGALSHHPHLLDGLPNVTVAALGGLAPKHLPLGVSSRELILHRIGMGSLLTFGNRHGTTCLEYGERALTSGEDWEANTMRVTLLLIRLTEESKFSFAADGRFHLSWQEKRMPDVPLCLLVDGSWKDWLKYARFAGDPSFLPAHQKVLAEVSDVLKWLTRVP